MYAGDRCEQQRHNLLLSLNFRALSNQEKVRKDQGKHLIVKIQKKLLVNTVATLRHTDVVEVMLDCSQTRLKPTKY